MDVGIFSPERLVTDIDGACEAEKMARDEGLTIVLTNEEFDLANPGHVRLLHEASKLADLLFVGIKSDSTIQSYDLPIISEFDRAYMIAALGCVDVVFIYGDPDFSKPLEKIRPDVYVAESDGEVPVLSDDEKKVIDKLEIAVKNISIYSGYSTANIINRIVNSMTKWGMEWGPIQCLFDRKKTAPGV